MPYKEFTECVKPADYSNFGMNMAGFIANVSVFVFGVVLGSAVGIALGGPVWIIIAIGLTFEAIVLMRWYLYGRLICLGDPGVCAVIGIVTSHNASDPSWGKKYGDNDYNMNLLLAPLSPAEYASLDDRMRGDYWGPPQGHLLAENQAILGIGKSYPQEAHNDAKHLKALHCEFEGEGVHTLLILAYATMVVLLAMLAAWLLGAGLPATLFAIGVFLFGFLLTALLLLFGPGLPSGNPLDVDDSFGNHAENLHRGDVVVIRGQWIYDSGHEGWNEIHPVRHGQIIGTLRSKDDIGDEWRTRTWADFRYTDEYAGVAPDFKLPDEFERFQEHWCGVLDDAKKANEEGNRNKPENDWGIHPLVDGCTASPRP